MVSNNLLDRHSSNKLDNDWSRILSSTNNSCRIFRQNDLKFINKFKRILSHSCSWSCTAHHKARWVEVAQHNQVGHKVEAVANKWLSIRQRCNRFKDWWSLGSLSKERLGRSLFVTGVRSKRQACCLNSTQIMTVCSLTTKIPKLLQDSSKTRRRRKL